jgi:putative transcriptional regulator
MEEGMLHATVGSEKGATGVAVTKGSRGEAVGVTEFEGIVDYEPGSVTILPVPSVEKTPQLPSNIDDVIGPDALVVAAGIEAVSCLRQAGIEPDIRFGTAVATSEAATRGLDVVLCVVESLLSRHTTVLRDEGIRFEVLDTPEAKVT